MRCGRKPSPLRLRARPAAGTTTRACRELTAQVLRAKFFEGAAGFKVTEPVRARIALHAAVPSSISGSIIMPTGARS
jgi:Mlc titration factor MtfA (ptsG expression regulator)